MKGSNTEVNLVEGTTDEIFNHLKKNNRKLNQRLFWVIFLNSFFRKSVFIKKEFTFLGKLLYFLDRFYNFG